MQGVILVFAIFTFFGSFAAWRRSPLYSLKTTFRLIGVMIGLLALMGVVMWLIFSSKLRSSPEAQVAAVLGAVLVLTTGMAVVIVRITDSHVAQLPPAVQLVTTNRHKIMPWIWRFLIFLLVMAAASLMAPGEWFWLPAGIGGFITLCCLPALSLLYMMARRNDRAMTAVMASPWAHWQYSPEEWAAWAQNQMNFEKSKEKPLTWKASLLVVALCVGSFGLGAVLQGESLKESAIMIGGMAAVVILLLAFLFWFQRVNPGRRYRRLLAAPAETWFGAEGLFANGQFWPWILSGKYLLEADAIRNEKDPPDRLVFVFESFNGSASTRVLQRVLVPSGGWADVAQLQRNLSAQCPKAVVRLA